MCGITGVWHLDKQPIFEEKIVDFTNSLSHRGPDGQGIYIDNEAHLALGHRRLSILDLSERGKQPMTYANGRYWITFNGEIFNFIELRKELIGKGYKFLSDTDTEIILAAWDYWGVDCLMKFNGMWAFAIWDSWEKSLFLARDRFAISPLYYTFIPHQLFAFASETIAFKYLEGFERRFDYQKVQHEIVENQHLDSLGHTIFENIYQVIGGHYLFIRPNQNSIQQKRWWNTLDNLVSVPEKYEDQVTQFKEIFDNSCLLRLRSDVPIGTALSGGLDSSSIYCNIHQLRKAIKTSFERVPTNWQRAYIAVFPNTSQDEKHFADQVIDYTQGEARYIYPDAENISKNLIESTLLFDHIYDSPIFSSSAVYKAMRQDGIRVSLDGHGVDEMLLGYPHLVKMAYKQATQAGNSQFAQDIETTYLQMFSIAEREKAKQRLLENHKVPFKLKTFLYENLTPHFLRSIYKDWKNKILKKEINEVLYIENTRWLPDFQILYLESLTDKPVETGHLPLADQVLYQTFHETTLPTILRNFDRTSLAHGVEIRMPFMDWRLVTYIFSLPLESKIGGGFTKKILRDAMQGIIPEGIRQRTLKIGFSAPLYEWFSGELKEYLLDTVCSQSFLQSPLWNGKLIANFVAQRVKNNTWDRYECTQIWKYLNAHILMNQQSWQIKKQEIAQLDLQS
ncbi:asparagine synthase (glutamine-hydrolyzing) [Thermoflexibacter ruber]|uniref:asparagine synthase (glutamine-hydrolyzing) n=1 Tax=Thermoflexibacter ruber TaxID=1003 RepID=A0A1I2IV35_9BACT|nr:asparagine synthase (glutamine-hydrolyzing) [Thermoflexibacter ruber]SFF46134.1 asparagine synthase (glutamine-hydrolysing) [Thermoflexibacter ruber]